MNILMTGNPEYGIAKGIYELHPVSAFVSRTAPDIQMDLTLEYKQDELADLSLDYDCFINNSLLRDFDQCSILQKVWTKWKDNNHKGLIINCGSAVDYMIRPDNRLYSVGKKALRDLSRNLSLYASWENSGIRCSYVSFGGVQTTKTMDKWPHFQHMAISECAAYIDFIINSPAHLNIDELHFTPIQPKPKEIMKQDFKNQGGSIPHQAGEYVNGNW